MRYVPGAIGLVLGLAVLVVGAVAGSSGAIIGGVVLLGLSSSLITIPRLMAGAGVSLKPSPVPHELRRAFGIDVAEYERVVTDSRRFSGTIVSIENDDSELGIGKFGTRIVVKLDGDPDAFVAPGRVTVHEFLGPAETIQYAPGTTLHLLRSDKYDRYVLEKHARPSAPV